MVDKLDIERCESISDIQAQMTSNDYSTRRSTLMRLQNSISSVSSNLSSMKKVIFTSILLTAVFCGAIFGLVLSANEMSKEVITSSSGELLSASSSSTRNRVTTLATQKSKPLQNWSIEDLSRLEAISFPNMAGETTVLKVQGFVYSDDYKIFDTLSGQYALDSFGQMSRVFDKSEIPEEFLEVLDEDDSSDSTQQGRRVFSNGVKLHHGSDGRNILGPFNLPNTGTGAATCSVQCTVGNTCWYSPNGCQGAGFSSDPCAQTRRRKLQQWDDDYWNLQNIYLHPEYFLYEDDFFQCIDNCFQARGEDCEMDCLSTYYGNNAQQLQSGPVGPNGHSWGGTGDNPCDYVNADANYLENWVTNAADVVGGAAIDEAQLIISLAIGIGACEDDRVLCIYKPGSNIDAGKLSHFSYAGTWVSGNNDVGCDPNSFNTIAASTDDYYEAVVTNSNTNVETNYLVTEDECDTISTAKFEDCVLGDVVTASTLVASMNASSSYLTNMSFSE